MLNVHKRLKRVISTFETSMHLCLCTTKNLSQKFVQWNPLPHAINVSSLLQPPWHLPLPPALLRTPTSSSSSSYLTPKKSICVLSLVLDTSVTLIATFNIMVPPGWKSERRYLIVPPIVVQNFGQDIKWRLTRRCLDLKLVGALT